MIAHRYAELSQVRMHYLEAGNGNDVVLLSAGIDVHIEMSTLSWSARRGRPTLRPDR